MNAAFSVLPLSSANRPASLVRWEGWGRGERERGEEAVGKAPTDSQMFTNAQTHMGLLPYANREPKHKDDNVWSRVGSLLSGLSDVGVKHNSGVKKGEVGLDTQNCTRPCSARQ